MQLVIYFVSIDHVYQGFVRIEFLTIMVFNFACVNFARIFFAEALIFTIFFSNCENHEIRDA